MKKSERERLKLEKALTEYAALAGLDAEKLKGEVDISSLYTDEDAMYEQQSVYNFFTYRVKPILDGKKPGETTAKYANRVDEWEKAYHEWKIRECEGCHSTFAYALDYDGVKFCSLECLGKALAEVGISVSRGRELTKRWGFAFHPAVVPSSAFQAMKDTFSENAKEAFVP